MIYSLRLTAIAASCFVFASCNTFSGMGGDIKTFGNGVANSAQGKGWYGEEKAPPTQQATDGTHHHQMQPSNVPQTKAPQ